MVESLSVESLTFLKVKFSNTFYKYLSYWWKAYLLHMAFTEDQGLLQRTRSPGLKKLESNVKILACPAFLNISAIG